MTGRSARLTERPPSRTKTLGLGHDTNTNALQEKTAFNLLT
ncbi:hypothetical protein [Streptomyces sp. AK010]|nr:hypothetical protein [Streptomyces sp. AK010]MBB6414557.1 hypothetical protein [Streptomyces sp. AK010]